MSVQSLYLAHPLAYLEQIPPNQKSLLSEVGQKEGAMPRLVETLAKPATYSAKIGTTDVEFSISYLDLFCSFLEQCRNHGYTIQGPFLKGSAIGERIIEGTFQEIADYDFCIKGFAPDFQKWAHVQALFLGTLAEMGGITYQDQGNFRHYFWNGKELSVLEKDDSFLELPYCGSCFVAEGLKNKFPLTKGTENRLLLTVPTKPEEGVSKLDFCFWARSSAQAFSDVDSRHLDLSSILEAYNIARKQKAASEFMQKYICDIPVWVRTVDGYLLAGIPGHIRDNTYSIIAPGTIYDALKLYIYRNVKNKRPLNSRSVLESAFCSGFISQFFEKGDKGTLRFKKESFFYNIDRFFEAKPFFKNNAKNRVLYLLNYDEVIKRNEGDVNSGFAFIPAEEKKKIHEALATSLGTVLNIPRDLSFDELIGFLEFVQTHVSIFQGGAPQVDRIPQVSGQLRSSLEVYFPLPDYTLQLVKANLALYGQLSGSEQTRVIDEFVQPFDKKDFKVGCFLFGKCGRKDLFRSLYTCADVSNRDQFRKMVTEEILADTTLVNELNDANADIFEFTTLTKESRAHVLKITNSFDKRIELYEKSIRFGDQPSLDELFLCPESQKEKGLKKLCHLVYIAAHANPSYLCHYPDLFNKLARQSVWDNLKMLCSKHQKTHKIELKKIVSDFVSSIGENDPFCEQVLSEFAKTPVLKDDRTLCLYPQLVICFKKKPAHRQMLAAFMERQEAVFALPKEEFSKVFILFIERLASHKDDKVHQVLARGLKIDATDAVIQALSPAMEYLRLVPSLQQIFPKEEVVLKPAVDFFQELDESRLNDLNVCVALGQRSSVALGKIDSAKEGLSLHQSLFKAEKKVRCFMETAGASSAQYKQLHIILSSLIRLHVKIFNRPSLFVDQTAYDKLKLCVSEIEESLPLCSQMQPDFYYQFLLNVTLASAGTPNDYKKSLFFVGAAIFKKLMSSTQGLKLSAQVRYFDAGYQLCVKKMEKSGAADGESDIEKYVEFGEMVGGHTFPKIFEAWLKTSDDAEKAARITILKVFLASTYGASEALQKKEMAQNLLPLLARLISMMQIQTSLDYSCESFHSIEAVIGSVHTKKELGVLTTLLGRMQSFVSSVEDGGEIQKCLPSLHTQLIIAEDAAIHQTADQSYISALYRLHSELILQSYEKNRNPLGELRLIFGVMRCAYAPASGVDPSEILTIWKRLIPLMIRGKITYLLLKEKLEEFRVASFLSPQTDIEAHEFLVSEMIKIGHPDELINIVRGQIVWKKHHLLKSS